jgi:hypothetical protein
MTASCHRWCVDITEALASLAPALATRAAQQRGVFTSQQAMAAGYSMDEIQRLRRSRPARWLSIRRGVYVVAGWWRALPVLEQHRVGAFAVSLVLDEPFVLSHQTAAIELRLAMLEPDLTLHHVTRGELEGARTEAGVKHHAAEVLPTDLVRIDGLPVTPLDRTAVDVARAAERLECAVAVCDSALRAGVTPDRLVEMQVRCRNWPGARLASRAVAMADGRADNPGESWSRVVLATNGHEPSDLQHAFYDRAGLIGYSDFFWEDTRTVGEFDGKLKYRVPPGADAEDAGRIVWQEKVREDRFRAIGLSVVRWGYADLYSPASLVARVSRARSRNGWSGYLPGA